MVHYAPRNSIPIVVLDTNVVLDWLVFRDPSCTAFQAAFAIGAMRWCASVPMRNELAQVLGRGVAQAWKPDLAALWSHWDRDCDELAAPDPSPPASRLRCSDTDDQMFIDFALAHGARWLLSRDRAVLKLARRARPFGLDILTPVAWAASRAPQT
jgi:predicted nucleic acid-binding protein